MSREILTLPQRLDKLENDHPPIDIDTVNFDIVDPRKLREGLGGALAYFARVERLVELNLLQLATLLPYSSDELKRFYGVWSSQELPHAQIFEKLEGLLGIEPFELNLTDVSPSLKLGGAIAHIHRVHDVLELVYLTTGAMHERMTAYGYGNLKQQLLGMNEIALAETAISQIIPQESGHYSYYRAAAKETRDRLAPWQVRLAFLIRKHSYSPVGASDKTQRANFGRVAVQLGIEPKLEQIATGIQNVAQELVADAHQGLKVPQFVLAAMQDAVARYRAGQATELHFITPYEGAT